MRVLVTGATGFVGTRVVGDLLARHHSVTATGTSGSHHLAGRPGLTYLAADTTRRGHWQEAAARADAVVNLAGRSIFQRWSPSAKRQIVDSRMETTRRIVEALDAGRPGVLVSASAVGYYGDGGEAELTEDSPAGRDFAARLCADWEAAATAAPRTVRVVTARLGIVLGNGGGALARMLPAYRAFAGGPLGSGRQWFPWIHMDDLVAAVDFIVRSPDLSGPVNLCAPEPVRNRELARTLGRVLRRPAVIRTPAVALRLVLGELADTLLASQRVVPARLTAAGFTFRYDRLEAALRQILGPSPPAAGGDAANP